MNPDSPAWVFATPLALLFLLERFGVPMAEVARWLHVPRSNISMWRHGTKAVPAKHLQTLRERAQETLARQAELTEKAASLAATDTLRQALRTEFEARYSRWEAEMLQDAATRPWYVDYVVLGSWVRWSHASEDVPEPIALLIETMAAKVRRIRERDHHDA